MSKTKTAENTSQDTTTQEPEQPYFPPQPGGGGSSDTQSTRGVYDGGAENADNADDADERAHLLPTPSRYGEMPQVQPGEEVPLEALRTRSQTTKCPHCRKLVLSTVEYTSGFCTWITCTFCFKRSKNVIHSCPICNRVMAKYSRFLRRIIRY